MTKPSTGTFGINSKKSPIKCSQEIKENGTFELSVSGGAGSVAKGKTVFDLNNSVAATLAVKDLASFMKKIRKSVCDNEDECKGDSVKLSSAPTFTFTADCNPLADGLPSYDFVLEGKDYLYLDGEKTLQFLVVESTTGNMQLGKLFFVKYELLYVLGAEKPTIGFGDLGYSVDKELWLLAAGAVGAVIVGISIVSALIGQYMYGQPMKDDEDYYEREE